MKSVAAMKVMAQDRVGQQFPTSYKEHVMPKTRVQSYVPRSDEFMAEWLLDVHYSMKHPSE